MRFGIVTNTEAAFIRARWWKSAKRELIIWAVCFVLGCAVFAEPLRALHWPSWIYWAIAGSSLLLFSRLAIWLTLIVAAIAHILLGVTGHSVVLTFQIMSACIFAIILRSPFTLFGLFLFRSSVRTAGQHSWMAGEIETPEYDSVHDEHVYKDGRREPAYLQPRKNTDWVYGDEDNRNSY